MKITTTTTLPANMPTPAELAERRVRANAAGLAERYAGFICPDHGTSPEVVVEDPTENRHMVVELRFCCPRLKSMILHQPEDDPNESYSE